MIQVLIADDHPLIRDALRACFEDETDITVAAEVDQGQEAIRAADRLRPDVITVDLYFPDLDGIDVIQEIIASWPEAHILVFTSSTDDDRVAQALEAGALGYLIKDSPREEILQAVREVSQGRSYLSATVAGKLAKALRQRRPAAGNPARNLLTEREEKILALISEGDSNAEIAQKLFISQTTVRTHIAHILQKLGFKNRSELMMHLLQQKRNR